MFEESCVISAVSSVPKLILFLFAIDNFVCISLWKIIAELIPILKNKDNFL
jgi:hypothetical protein